MVVGAAAAGGSPAIGPAVKAPKLRREATQLCSSLERTRPGPGPESWGRAGADQERTVPRPKDPSVANNVAEGETKVNV